MTIESVVEEILDLPAEPDGKLVGAGLDGVPRRRLAQTPVPLADLATPVLTLDRSAVAANIRSLQAWCEQRGYAVAPHGKTTMAAQLWAAQLAAGAWGITVATEWQLRTAVAWGVPRIQLANVLARAEAARWLGALVAGEGAPEVLTWVDSPEAVGLLTGDRPVPLRVLLDIGRAGGRTGVRDAASASAVIDSIRRAPGVELAGTAGYEGAIGGEGTDGAGVAGYAAELLARHRELVVPAVTGRPVLSIGGSDRLAEVAAGIADLRPDDGQVIIRSGVSIVHDDGLYRDALASAPASAPRFHPALRLIGTVLGVHDGGIALLDVGRRDAGHDHGLPVPLELWRGDAVLARTDGGTPVAALNDQHAFVPVGVFGVAPRVGDRVLLGVSHPCTTLDLWRDLAELGEAATPTSSVIGLIRTHF